MNRRNKVLRATEILLILAFVISFTIVNQWVVTAWYSTSMNSALERINSILEEGDTSQLADMKQEDWSERQIVRFAAYYLNNDAYDQDTVESVRDLCKAFDAIGAYIIDPSGQMIAGYGVLSDGQYFQDSCFDDLRNVTAQKPVTVFDSSFELSEDIARLLGDYFSVISSCYLDDNRILVMHLKGKQEVLLEDTYQLRSKDAVFSRRVFGSQGFFFWTSAEEAELWFLTAEDERAFQDIEGTQVPQQARRNGFHGFITLADKKYYCCTKYNSNMEAYFHCAVPALSLYYTTGFVSIGELIVVLFFILLTRMYARLILPDAIKSARNSEVEKKYKKNLRILLLTSVVVTLTVNIFSTTLYLYTEQVQTNSERSEQLAELLNRFEEKQQASSISYRSYISTITGASAALIPQNAAFVQTAKLEELAQTLGAERVLLYDSSATVYASNRNYNGLTLSDDPQSMSYEFRWVLRGEPLLIQDKPDSTYLNAPYRFSGAAMMDRAGKYIGMVQIAMDPAVYDKMESSISMHSVLNAFAPEKDSVVMAVDAAGNVVSTDSEYSGKMFDTLGIPQEILQDDYTGFFTFNREKVIGTCSNCEDYHAIVISPTADIPAKGLRYGLLTAIPGVLAEILFHLVLLCYLKSCRTMDEKEVRFAVKAGRKEAREAGEEMHAFAYRMIICLAALVSLVFVFRRFLFEKGSLEYFIFINEWAKGLHIFTITRCLIYIAFALFVMTAVSKLFGAVASILISRQETYIRMGLSFFKYGVRIATVYICASELGAPTASLIASAGVLSVMLSFGAQSIVADIISGLFIVFEGTFKVGDMITVDDWHGQVEEIGIRNTRMRDLITEDVKIMNNSTIKTIINYSERPCWSAIRVGVDYETDIPRLEAIFQREKVAMRKNIPLGIGEIVYLGIDELSESQMTLKFQILCKNQDQLKVRRALNREIRLMFARNNITIPFPQVTLSNREVEDSEDIKAP